MDEVQRLADEVQRLVDEVQRLVDEVQRLADEVQRLVDEIQRNRSDSVLDSAVFLKGSSFTVCGGPGQPPCDEKVPEPSSVLGLLAIGALGTGSILKQKLAKGKKPNKTEG